MSLLEVFVVALIGVTLAMTAGLFILKTVVDTIEDAWHHRRHWFRIDRSHRHKGHRHSRWP